MSTAKHITSGAQRPASHPLDSGTKTIAAAHARAKLLGVIRRDVNRPVQPPQPPRQLSDLDRAYDRFCRGIDGMKRTYGFVPADGAASVTFLNEVIARAWFSLARVARVVSDDQRGAVAPFVADLVFARLDHRKPGAFVAGLDAQTKARWLNVCRALDNDKVRVVAPASAAVLAIRNRIAAEAHLHRPIAALFAADADIG